MVKKSWSTLDFSGGLQQATSIMNHKNTELSIAKNADFSSSLGGIRKRNGYTQYGSAITNTPEVLGLYDFEQSDGDHIYLSSANTAVSTEDQSQTTADWGPSQKVEGAKWHAQTFQAGVNDDYHAIKMFVVIFGSPDDLLVELRDVSSGDPGSTIHATTRVPATSITSNDWNTFTFDSSYTVTSGTDYAIVLRQYNDGGSGTNAYKFGGKSTSGYANGVAKKSTDSGSTWSNDGTVADFGFYTYYLSGNSDIFRDVSGTWTTESQSLTLNSKYEFETFLNKVWVVSYDDPTRNSSDGDTWIDSGDATAYTAYVLDAPSGKYIKQYANRLWIANNSTDRFKLYYSSPIQGYVGAPITGLNGAPGGAGTTTITVDETKYLKDGMKFDVHAPGDTSKRSNGDSVEVVSVDTETTFTIASTDCSAWADNDELYLEDSRGTEYILWDSDISATNKVNGTDWVPVGPDDGQPITWLETGFDRLLIFKSGSIWTSDPDANLSKVANRGTPCGRSVVNINEQVIFFNPDGFYALSGEGVEKVSHGIQKYVDDISPSDYEDICAGGIRNNYLVYVGSLPSYDLTNVVLEYDTDTGSWTMHTVADEINVWATVEVSNQIELWFGTSDGEIHRWDYGSTDDGTVVSLEAETGWYHLNSPSIVKKLSEIVVYSDDSPGVRCLIKSDREDWKDLGETGEDIATRFTKDITGRLFKLRFEYANEPTIEVCGATFVWEETNAK